MHSLNGSFSNKRLRVFARLEPPETLVLSLSAQTGSKHSYEVNPDPELMLTDMTGWISHRRTQHLLSVRQKRRIINTQYFNNCTLTLNKTAAPLTIGNTHTHTHPHRKTNFPDTLQEKSSFFFNGMPVFHKYLICEMDADICLWAAGENMQTSCEILINAQTHV